MECKTGSVARECSFKCRKLGARSRTTTRRLARTPSLPRRRVQPGATRDRHQIRRARHVPRCVLPIALNNGCNTLPFRTELQQGCSARRVHILRSAWCTAAAICEAALPALRRSPRIPECTTRLSVQSRQGWHCFQHITVCPMCAVVAGLVAAKKPQVDREGDGRSGLRQHWSRIDDGSTSSAVHAPRLAGVAGVVVSRPDGVSMPRT